VVGGDPCANPQRRPRVRPFPLLGLDPRTPTGSGGDGFEDVLDPNNGARFHGDVSNQFQGQSSSRAIAALYSSFSQAQTAKLALRPFPFTTPSDFWDVLPQGIFQTNRRRRRGPDGDQSGYLDANTKVTVAINVDPQRCLRTPNVCRKRKSEPTGRISRGAKGSEPQRREQEKGILESQAATTTCTEQSAGGGGGLYDIVFLSGGFPYSICTMAISTDSLRMFWTRQADSAWTPRRCRRGADCFATWSQRNNSFSFSGRKRPNLSRKSRRAT